MGESYPYEDLDGRRFQRLAQSLISAERPRAQCLPISGPDGGRDAIGLEFDDDHEDLVDAVIYQVKFREQNPLGIPTTDDLFTWVTKNLGSEIPKLKTLKEIGAREFVFVTNIPASGHLTSGLRDRVQKWVMENLPIPTTIWWRDDVDARLDRHPSLVFKFMLFRGPDSVHAYLAQTLAKTTPGSPAPQVEYSVRNPAVTTILYYLSRQYEEESSLRFKQAHIDAPLLDSFVDVPLEIGTYSSVSDNLKSEIDDLVEELHASDEEPDEDYDNFLQELSEHEDSLTLGAASALLSDHDISELDHLVIEAGPGQGKSTLIQFLGQVHRARLLNRVTDLASLPARLVDGPLRLPLRIELRHLGKWLQGISPWSGSERSIVTTGTPSLHSYIADHVQHVTGGMHFSSDDLVAIVSSTPTLLLLDGLDEVADISLRDQVVRTVSAFVQDIEILGAKLQVVATGRPSSLASAPTFPRSIFLYGKLEDLTIDLTEKYANAWITRRALAVDQASELRNVLAGCLNQPHVAELARTPMQLAILLWLVHTRGWNLPDKRTALYDEYINTLLDREADKTAVVREHREVLLEIHGHLGWLLHARSQERLGEHGAGDIEGADLKRAIWEYLEAKEGPSDRIKEILEGINRISVLVDRIQDRFEFQVQPLREFFAARHLYKTAPYHSNAVEVTGSRPERLEALIRDPHWLNVARFFCGWYDVGELADLTQRIGELRDDESYRYSLHSRLLVAYLLNDYVSAAAPKCTRKIASYLTDMLSIRQILEAQQAGLYQAPSPLEVLPADSGLPVLVEATKEHYTGAISDAIVYELAKPLRLLPDAERGQWWMHNLLRLDDADRDEWIRRGVIANCLREVPATDLQPIFNEASTTLRWVRCVEAGRIDVATTEQRMRRFIDALARGYSPLAQGTSDQAAYMRYITDQTLCTRFDDPRQAYRGTEDAPAFAFDGDPGAIGELGRISQLAQRCQRLRRRSNRGLMARANIVGEELGEAWAAWRIALSVAPWGDCSGYPLVSDGNFELSARAAALWKHRGEVSFWRDAFRASEGDGHTMAITSALMSWGPGRVIVDLSDELRQLCQELEPWEFSAVRRFVGMMSAPQGGLFRIDSHTRIREGELRPLTNDMPTCLLTILEQRMRPNAARELAELIENSRPCVIHEGFVSAFIVSSTLKHMAARRDWGDSLGVIRSNYERARSDALHTKGISQRGAGLIQNRMHTSTANLILSQPHKFPMELLMIAEARLERRQHTLHQIAQAGQWFDQDY